MRNLLKGALLALTLAFGSSAMAQDTATAPTTATATPEMGTLVVNVEMFTSEATLPKRVDKQLKGGALEWGVKDGLLVFPMIGKQFIDFPINHMTRYGQSESLQLPAGEYRVTGIGLEMTTSFSVQKVLDRGAYVNEDVMTFKVEAGKTTTLNIKPVIYKDATFAVNFYMPTLLASTKSETATSEEKALNTRVETSIAWPNYKGPLKFVAK